MSGLTRMQSDLASIDSNLDAIIAQRDALLWACQRIAGLGDMPGTRLEAAREQAIPLARAALREVPARNTGAGGKAKMWPELSRIEQRQIAMEHNSPHDKSSWKSLGAESWERV